MRKDSGYLSILLGIGILAAVTLGMGGIAYSFYRTEMAEEKEESLDMANDDSPFEQLKREKNIVITPVPKENGGSRAMDLDEEGIPTGTYSNPPNTVSSPSSMYSTEVSPSSIAENRNFDSESLIDNQPNYSDSSSSNDFNNRSNSSLVEPLENSDLLDIPENDSDTDITKSRLESGL